MFGLIRVLALALALVVALAASPVLARVETPPPAVATALVEAHNEVIGFAAVSAEIAMICIAGGGLIMHLMVGEVASTLAGALAGYVVGSTIASWLFHSKLSRNYIIQRVGPDAAE